MIGLWSFYLLAAFYNRFRFLSMKPCSLSDLIGLSLYCLLYGISIMRLRLDILRDFLKSLFMSGMGSLSSLEPHEKSMDYFFLSLLSSGLET